MKNLEWRNNCAFVPNVISKYFHFLKVCHRLRRHFLTLVIYLLMPAFFFHICFSEKIEFFDKGLGYFSEKAFTKNERLNNSSWLLHKISQNTRFSEPYFLVSGQTRNLSLKGKHESKKTPYPGTFYATYSI